MAVDLEQITSPVKYNCYIHNGEKWVKYITQTSNKPRLNFVYNNLNPEAAVLGFAVLGTMKLGEEI